ncbi:D-glycero-beta-D-manno-heptose 1,7-bisphosphate 7-phosphatase [SAR92 clade bacterium H246]|jgi:D-glycero-D-manno-heptose 1,7-bisphosphate phosphatase
MKVAFLDRDGVINVDNGYVHHRENFVFTEGCTEALQLLEQKGFALIIVTNQSGIGRNYYSEQDYQQLTSWYREQLLQHGIAIAGIYHCPHAPEALCDCRKPAPGLFLQAAAQHDIDFASSIMIGDKQSDAEAATAAGIRHSYLLGPACGASTKKQPQYASLLDCVRNII